MSRNTPKRRLFSHFAELGRVLGNKYRLELLELLAQSEQPVEVLSARTGVSFANVSQHLQQLRKAGLIIGRRNGKNIIYRLQDGPIVEAIMGLRALAEHNMAKVKDTVARYFDTIDSLEPIEAEELISRLRDESVILLDVRPEDEFRAGHLPLAKNIELSALERRLSELPKNCTIVAYCRGPYCILSYRAIETLRSRGFEARRFKDGFPEWKAAGRKVELGLADAPPVAQRRSSRRNRVG